MLRVDLGCGTNKPDGFVGVDTYPALGVDIVADLNQQFPFSDDSVDVLRAYDVIEHLPDRIHTMNEIWRICKPGAKIDIFVPSTDGRGAFQDPTHVSFWNINSFLYYCVDFPHYLELCRRYGFKGAFKVVKLENEETFTGVIHVRAELIALKSQVDLELLPAESNAQNKTTFDSQTENNGLCSTSFNKYTFNSYETTNHNFIVIEPLIQEESRPLWSVMIPTYNGTKYLEQTLRSVLEQDPGSNLMQIEVIDDCSTQDDPEELVKKIGQGRVSFYRQPKNVGLIGNWNACISRARGYWVHILHQDDVVKFGFYSRLQVAFEKKPTIGAAFCRYFYMDEMSCEQALSPLERETPGVISNWIERIAVMQRIECPSIVVKREVYEKLGGFCQEAYYAADWEMWKRIAAHYSVWFEPELLACYRLHSLSETSRLFSSGKNIADTRKAIEISQPYLPIAIAAELSKQARENCAFKALNIARRMLSAGNIDAAIAQIREGVKSSDSSDVIVSILELLQEIVKNSNQYNILPVNALDQFLAEFQSKEQAIALTDSLKLKDINLIIFPDWSQSEEILYQDLASVITNLVNHLDKNRMTLLIHTGNLSEDEANLFLADVVMNLLLKEDLNVADEPEISLVGQLNEIQWNALLPSINGRIVLLHENQEAMSQARSSSYPAVKVENIPTYKKAA